MKRVHNSRDAVTDAPAPRTKIHRAQSASAARYSRRSLTQPSTPHKPTRAPVEIRTILINVPAIRNRRKHLKTNSRPQF
jgi:hypothetical protein